LSPRLPKPFAKPARLIAHWFRTLKAYAVLPFFFGLHLGCLAVFFVPATTPAVVMFFAFYMMRVWALTAGYHRYFAHRSYKTSRWFQFVIALMGCTAAQKGPMWWAGHHRIHHQHSDQEGDPHSPIINSVWWSHVGWVIDREQTFVVWDRMKDWHKYPELKWLERFNLLPAVLLGVASYLIGGVSGLVWGFVLSTVCVYHSTFLVNSLCHLMGYRRYNTTDKSRNNWLVAILTFGEGWHNNHHHYPSSARQGFTWWEVDISYIVLRGLKVLGLVWDIREPTPRALAKDRIMVN
jgi:stearoyl-CoA desaturase (delta-9 desaturase)